MMINMTSEFNDSHKKSLRGNHGWAHWDTHGEVKQNIQNELK
jgi:hypothetical protein